MTDKEKLKIMETLSQYKNQKIENKYIIKIDGYSYKFKSKSDAIKFSYFITLMENKVPVGTQKLIICDDGDNEINFYLTDILLDINYQVAMIDTANKENSWYDIDCYGIEGLRENDCNDENGFKNLIDIMQYDFKMSFDMSNLQENGTLEYFVNYKFDWQDTLKLNDISVFGDFDTIEMLREEHCYY